MRSRQLGSEGPIVSAIGLGCMGMSVSYGVSDESEAIATIQLALDQGVTLLNTADVYGNGANEELIARAIAGRRGDAVLTTKFGQIRNTHGSGAVNGRSEYVQAACDASLKRLGTDYIDIYCQHRVDPDTPIEETVGAMARLIEQGKVRYIGLSEAGAETIRRAHATHPISCLETEYSLWTRDAEAEIIPTCRELGIGFVAYAPLGRGFLSGAIRQPTDLLETDGRRGMPRFSEANLEKNQAMQEALNQIAAGRGFRPAQVALAWLLGRGKDIVPIPGTQRRKFMQENIRAVNFALSDDILLRMETLFAPGVAEGNRYPDAQMARLGL